MAKISVVVLAGTETHGDLARVLNALELVKEAVGAGDDVELVFDGAGVQWVPSLSDADHKLHGLYEAVATVEEVAMPVVRRAHAGHAGPRGSPPRP